MREEGTGEGGGGSGCTCDVSHTSHVTRHTSHVTHHTSRIPHLSLVDIFFVAFTVTSFSTKSIIPTCLIHYATCVSYIYQICPNRFILPQQLHKVLVRYLTATVATHVNERVHKPRLHIHDVQQLQRLLQLLLVQQTVLVAVDFAKSLAQTGELDGTWERGWGAGGCV